MASRLVILCFCFLAAAGLAARGSRPEQVPLRQPLDDLPSQIGRWTGREAKPFTGDVLAVLGVDEHVNRVYTTQAEPPVALYIGYYRSQREGDTIHSPMNCLPGAGWQPASHEHLAIQIPDRPEPIVVNRYLIQKGTDRQLVFYWYQSHGRVVASEYWSKIFLVYDAVRLNRSDAALVRVVSPILQNEGGESEAEARAIDFVQGMFPLMARHLPS